MDKSFALSQRGISECLQELTQYQNTLTTQVEKFCIELAKVGIDAAYSILNTDDRVGGDYVTYERQNASEYIVVAQGEQVAFIEFGVGVIGQSGGYPSDKLPAGWQYNAMWSPWAHDLEDPDRWFYYEEDGQLNNTKGTLPVGFMNHASEVMRQQVLEIAKKVFS